MPTKCVQNLLGHDVAEQGRSLQAQLCHASFIVSPNPRGLGEDCVKAAADAESLDQECRCVRNRWENIAANFPASALRGIPLVSCDERARRNGFGRRV